MKIGIITYDVPHKKTQDVMFHLKAHGYDDVECISVPFIKRKRFVPLITHRLVNEIPVHPKDLCGYLGYKYKDEWVLDGYDKILIGGANILSSEAIGEHEIINAHPGYLPYVRGLDSLKWAILAGNPIGVTTHVINGEIDAGSIIDQRFIQVDYFDTIHSLGYKTYSLELEMLVEAIHNPSRKPITDVSRYPAKRRMPHRLEIKMMIKLEQLKLQRI